MAVELGFIDKVDKLLESRFFPSKVGGKPAWLNLEDTPSTEELTCSSCHSSMYFLCQLYCPINEKDTAFHRTIFVFLCTSKGCFQPNSNSNFTVYRNQLPKRNLYYPDTPPVQDVNWRSDITPAKFGVQVCSSCGIRSEQKCGDDQYACSRSTGVLPEYGLSIEPEDESRSETDSEESDGEENCGHANTMSYSSQLAELRQIASAQDDPSVEQIFSECNENAGDEAFTNFKACIKAQPEQVIRYDRNGEPLWLSKENIPREHDVPKCEYCGTRRVFEFQVLPQLLNHLNFDEEIDFNAGLLDWGTLAIYTCQDSCDRGSAYKKEFLWKQDVLS